MFLMPVLTGELGTMGRCDATFFSTMQSKEGNTHTHTSPFTARGHTPYRSREHM